MSGVFLEDLGGSVILKIDADNPGSRQSDGDSGDRGSPAASVVFVLMAGGFSPPPLGTAVGCSVLDLYLTREQTLLDRWQWAVSTLDRAGLAGDRLCLCGGSTPLPEHTPGSIKVVVDKSDYRGPAGSLRDACEEFGPETTIIAAEAARCCTIDLARMFGRHTTSGADITVGRNADQSPSGIYILSRSVLDSVPHAGFMDLKEQWLSKLIGEGCDVRVHELREAGALPLRTRAEFLYAMHVCSDEADHPDHAGLEPRVLSQTRRAGSVICEGAEVAPDAVLVDSLIMPGAKIEAGALLARCIVGTGCAVRAGQEIVDAVVGPNGITYDKASTQGAAR